MSRLFLSHSHHDNAEAAAVRDWLRAQGWDDVYLDFDPRRGLAAGERWQEALKAAADRCELILCLISEAWLASHWCRAEYDLVKLLGKRTFGVIVKPVSIEAIPDDLRDQSQVADLTARGPAENIRVRPPRS